MRLVVAFWGLATLLCTSSFANPYPNENLVPKDRVRPDFNDLAEVTTADSSGYDKASVEVLRVQIDWDAQSDQFRFSAATKEASGTEAFLRKARRQDPLGSFKGQLRLVGERSARYFDSIGTGEEYKRLTRALTFRFPYTDQKVLFELYAENSTTGEMQKVLERVIDPKAEARRLPAVSARELKIKLLKASDSQTEPKLTINVYAEGYEARSSAKFWKDAEKVVTALEGARFPYFKQMEIRAVFHPSNQKLGAAKELELPVAERDSFLGLYYPYWRNFGRWYHVVYPTREQRYRDGIGQVAYDYPIILIDSSDYWGVGNYKELTAIPSDSPSFTYLLLHELGHFFGLNEEYEGGGRTELQFAPGIYEPWSQNITFLRETSHAALKWNEFVNPSTPLPTPRSHWRTGVFGAYRGGYADSDSEHSHKPGLSCVMERYRNFCSVCAKAIVEVIRRDIE